MTLLGTIFKISRPHFWLYLAGPWLVGWAAGAHGRAPLPWMDLAFWQGFLFFLGPANFFLYGINDFFDADTDAFNAKKSDKEHRLRDTERRVIRWSLLITVMVSVLYYLTLQGWPTRLLFVIWFALSFFYSAPPLRFKARPFLDSGSNILYALPGFLAYFISVGARGGAPLPIWVWLACGLWTAAMHLFSAIPDIEADQQAGLSTTATVLGERWSLALCCGLWLNVAALLGLHVAGFFPAILIWIYPMMALLPVLRPALTIRRVYWWFPWVNGGMGFVLFGWAVLR